MTEPLDVAQLVSVALYSPKPDETVNFFYEMLGMEISHREGQSVYLRAYEDFYQYTLKITERDQPGLEEVTWRARSPEALDRLAATLKDSDTAIGWTEDDYAHGPAFKFTTPDGHGMKVLWELDYYRRAGRRARQTAQPPVAATAARRPGAANRSRQPDGQRRADPPRFHGQSTGLQGARGKDRQ